MRHPAPFLAPMLAPVLALTLVTAPAAPAHAQARPAAKAAAAKAAPAKPPAPKAPAAAAPAARAPSGPFDPQNPQTLIDVLAGLGAQAKVDQKAEDSVFLKVTSPAGSFGVQFAGCDAQGRKCKALAFDAPAEQRTPTLAQLNAFNQTSLMCRTWQAKDGRPHVVYSALVAAQDTRAELETHLGVWRGCLADFGAFLKDPNGFLAEAP